MSLVRAASRLSLTAALLLLLPASAAAQVRVGPVLGYSVLERKDTSLSHGRLEDEVTLGRTVLVGAVVEARFTRHDALTGEFVYGPYHNDIDRYCIRSIDPTGSVCTPQVGAQASSAILIGMQYMRSLGGGAWRPYLGGGIGIKRYSFKESYYSPRTSPTFSIAAGLETQNRIPIRLELRTIIVEHNQLLNDAGQVELQARFVALF